VYDVTDRGSFDNISNWVGQIQQHADVNVNKVLIGNKCDVDPAQVVVTEEEGKALAAEYKIQFFQTSAKQNLNVTEAFQAIAREVKDRRMKEGGTTAPTRRKDMIDINKQTKKCGGCCK